MAEFYSEDQPLRGETLDDKMDIEVRHGFIRKVFSLVTLQLIATTVIAAPFVVYNAAARAFIVQNQALFVIIALMPLVVLCCGMCNPSLMKTYPQNYVFLSLLTLSMGLLVGMSCVQYTAASIVIAAGMTAAITFALMLFACQTKHDFTGMGPYLLVFLLAMCFTSFIMMFLPYSRPVEIVYSGIGVCVFSFYIVYDTQLIVGGKHSTHRFGIDEYVFAAINLYMDIIQLFLHLLRLMGERR